MEASAHRANARAALKGNWVNAIIVALLVSLFGNAGTKFNINIESSQPVQVAPSDEMVRIFHQALGIAMPLLITISMVMFVVSLIVSGVLKVGCARYNLNLIDRRESDILDLLTAIPRFVDALVMHLLETLLTALGLLLLLVPGIMMIYGFAMAPYILSEDPECTGWEALKRSWAMMQGHKLELFWLELTFIGWDILASLTRGLGDLVLNPYKAAARASFYRDLSRELVF